MEANMKGIELSVDDSEFNQQLIFSDPLRIKQILFNLLNNAIKFTMRGFVKLTIQDKGLIQNSQDEHKIVFIVQDTGRGIKQNDIKNLFKLFGFLRINDNVNQTGIGLGLTIVKRLTEKLGGNIEVDSIWQQGTTFTLFIKAKCQNIQILEQQQSHNFLDVSVFDNRHIQEYLKNYTMTKSIKEF